MNTKILGKWWFWVIAVVVFLMVISVAFGEDEVDVNDEQTNEQVNEQAPNGLSFLDGFTEYGYSVEQIEDMRTILTNVGITEITDLEIEPVVAGMQVIQGIIYKDPDYQYTGKTVEVQFNIENGKIYLIAIHCPSHVTANQPTYLSGLSDRRADLYYDTKGGYLKKIDWENKAVVDY